MAKASLPMYDLPELQAAHDEFWSVLARDLRRNGIKSVPDRLSHGQPVRKLWNDPDLLISQCCGYDITNRYRDKLRPVATPIFSAFGCLGENYCSVVVAAADCPFKDIKEMAGTVAVINGPESHSGMSSLRHLVAQYHKGGHFFSRIKVSGSHLASLEAIRLGKADVAAIDSITMTLLQRHRPGVLDGLKVLGTTYYAPAPPYVVQASLSEGDVIKVRRALEEAFDDPDLAGCRERLLLNGVKRTKQEDYWILEAFEDHAFKHGIRFLE